MTKLPVRRIRQTITFPVSPKEIYETIMDPVKHAALTGAAVKIHKEVGSKFSVYDGEIEGVNLELTPDRKIVQSWRYSDWPSGHYSKCTFLLTKVPGGTRLTFSQTGVPDEFYDDIRQGWYEYYWEPMKKIFRGHQY
jgi:activator of HSP90 ATPase